MRASNALVFAGEFDSTKHYQAGDIVTDGGVTKVYNGISWEPLYGTHDDTNEEPPKTIVSKTCSQCGAPIKTYRTTCEYCGCRY